MDSQAWPDIWEHIKKWKTAIETSGERKPRDHRNKSTDTEIVTIKLEKFKNSWKLSYGNQNKISAEGWKVEKKLEIKNIEFKNKEIGRSIQE